MRSLLLWVARLAGLIGIAAMALSMIWRLLGAYWMGSFQVGSVLQAGMAAVLVACLSYLALLVEARSQ